MNEHQRRLWQRMIDLIQNYIDGQDKDFCGIVGVLEGALDASEIEDISLIEQWYDYWTPLEVRRAVEGNNVNKFNALDELNKMKTFLDSVI